MSDRERPNDNFSIRLNKHAQFVQTFGRQVFELEEKELIRVKETETYILLLSKKKIDLFTEEELKITIIPLTSIGDYFAGNYNEKRSGLKIWGAKIDLIEGKVQFAHCMSFEIKPDELKEKGLGSYVLGKLVRWVRQHSQDFKVKLWAASIDNNYPDNFEGLYKKFNLLKVKTISDIKEPPISDKVESIPIGEFLSEVIEKNTKLERKIENIRSDYIKKTNDFENIRSDYIKKTNDFIEESNRFQRDRLILFVAIIVLMLATTLLWIIKL